MFLNGRVVPVMLFGCEVYLLVINDKRQVYFFHVSSKYGRLKLCRSASNISTSRSTD